MNKVILSISIMVSNTIDTIEKCMKSIEPILKSIPSELVVVDTGGTDGSIEIAKKYADKVINFEWCNDFAKARNAGLEACTGEWFLFMDDDEWFDDVEELIAFFASQEYTKYHCASYLIRNYGDMQGTCWHDVRSIRLVQMEKDTRFVSPIHEMLVPARVPEKVLKVFAHHYGYVYKSEEERRKHALRNISILKDIVAKNPTDYRLLAQLAQEYRAVLEYQMSEELCLKALAAIKTYKNISEFQKKMLGWMLNNIVTVEIGKKDYETAFKYANDFLGFPWINIVTKNNLAYRLALVSFELERYEDAVCGIQIYENTYELLKDNIQLRRQEVVLEQEECIESENVAKIYVTAIRTLLRLQRVNDIHCYVEKFVELDSFNRSEKELEDIMQYVLSDGERVYSQKILTHLLQNEQVAAMINKIVDSDKWSDEEQSQLIEVLADIEGNDDFTLPYEIVCEVRSGNGQEISQRLKKYLSEKKDLMSTIFPVWQIVESCRLDIGEYIENNSLRNVMGEINVFVANASEKKINIILDIMKYIQHDSMKINILKMRCVEKKMRMDSIKEREWDELRQLGELYSNLVYDVYLNLYREESFYNECNCFLPKECQFAVKLRELLKHEKSILEGATLIKEATDIYPEMAAYCKTYILKIREKIEQEAKEQQEFKELAKMIKEKIYGFINRGEYTVAEQTLNQLALMMPDDGELEVIRQKIVEQRGI